MTDRSAEPVRIAVYDGADLPAPLPLSADAIRFVYVREGKATLTTAGTAQPLAADDGMFVDGAAELACRGATWIFEVAATTAPFLSQAALILAHSLRPGFARPYLVRADRIESRPGARTPRHGHRGPGLRRLIFGRLLAEVGDSVERIESGDAWFESGRDSVVGTNIGSTNAAFVRVMVLPADLKGGKSSFVPADAEEARKPRSVDNRLFAEVLI